MPDDMKVEMGEQMELAGDALLNSMRADVPRKTGKLAAGLSKKVLKGSLNLKVGFIGKPINRRLFYGRIVEFGRKAQTVNVTRRIKSGGRAYQMRVRAMGARPFVYSKRTDLRRVMGELLRAYWDKVLARAARGDISDA